MINILVLFHANNILDPEWIAVLWWWHHQHAAPSWSEKQDVFAKKQKLLAYFLKEKLQILIAYGWHLNLFVSDHTVRNLPLCEAKYCKLKSMLDQILYIYATCNITGFTGEPNIDAELDKP